MAKKKKSIENLRAELDTLNKRIEITQKKLETLQQTRKNLTHKIEIEELFEIKGLLKEQQLDYEQAKHILNSANPVLKD